MNETNHKRIKSNGQLSTSHHNPRRQISPSPATYWFSARFAFWALQCRRYFCPCRTLSCLWCRWLNYYLHCQSPRCCHSHPSMDSFLSFRNMYISCFRHLLVNFHWRHQPYFWCWKSGRLSRRLICRSETASESCFYLRRIIELLINERANHTHLCFFISTCLVLIKPAPSLKMFLFTRLQL